MFDQDLILLIYSLMQSFLISRYMYRWVGTVVALAWLSYPRSVGACSRGTFVCWIFSQASCY